MGVRTFTYPMTALHLLQRNSDQRHASKDLLPKDTASITRLDKTHETRTGGITIIRQKSTSGGCTLQVHNSHRRTDDRHRIISPHPPPPSLSFPEKTLHETTTEQARRISWNSPPRAPPQGSAPHFPARPSRPRHAHAVPPPRPTQSHILNAASPPHPGSSWPCWRCAVPLPLRLPWTRRPSLRPLRAHRCGSRGRLWHCGRWRCSWRPRVEQSWRAEHRPRTRHQRSGQVIFARPPVCMCVGMCIFHQSVKWTGKGGRGAGDWVRVCALAAE